MDETEARRFLITGAGGMIGSAFKTGTKLGRNQLDVTDAQQLKKKISAINPSAIIHLANLDIRLCESNPELARKTNIDATRFLIDAASPADIPLLFISSGCIFNGPKGQKFDESAKPEPQNFYSEAKVISENMLLKDYPGGSIIVRTGWVFGGHGAQHKKFVDQTIEKCRKDETIFASQNSEGSPTYVVDLVNQMTDLILAQKRGIFHVVNSEAATAWDIAEFLRDQLGSQSKIAQFVAPETDKKIKRSSCEVLSSKYIQLRDWRKALGDYVEYKNKT